MRITPPGSVGVDRMTGRVLTGFDHVRQSLSVILTTSFGERVMRRYVGSFVPPLLGEPLIPRTLLRFWTAVCVAIELFEPRMRVRRIVPTGSVSGVRLGQLKFKIDCDYMPRGHLGDFTVESSHSVASGQLMRAGAVSPSDTNPQLEALAVLIGDE